MKLEGKLPVPSLSAILGDPIGRKPRVVEIVGAPARGPGRGRGVRICGVCRGEGHQRNSFDCPKRGQP
jgi:hypothetical protein